MKLHLDKKLFRQAVQFTADQMQIPAIYVEKDYWVTYALYSIFQHEIGKETIFKGGTSLSKCYNLIERFSEDIDLVVLKKETDTSNQLTKKIKTIGNVVNEILPEIEIAGLTHKIGMVRKTAHSYNKEFQGNYGQVRDTIVIEATWLGYYEPYTTQKISSLIGEMMQKNNQKEMAKEYNLLAFDVFVLEPTRTICEKIMSLVRFSYSENPIRDLGSKIRHIYDLNQLLLNEDFLAFFNSDSFDKMLLKVAQDDVTSFKNNNEWLKNHPKDCLLFENPEKVWKDLRTVYNSAFKNLVYGVFPDEKEMLNTLLLLKNRLRKIEWEIQISKINKNKSSELDESILKNNKEIDILEDEILEKYPEVLDILLKDQTTQKNIIWATNNYEYLGELYSEKKQIKPELITGVNGSVIMPRVQKDQILQNSRVKNMAEVFTPSWMCNMQNNAVDNAWFERGNVFNEENINEKKWKTNHTKIEFPQNKNWESYVNNTVLEITCGEAPYITSRYDTTTGQFIKIEDRIGLLDRKLRVINENVHDSGSWLKFAQVAYKNTYAYEWQGDSLLLAREAMLFTFIENYKMKFKKEPLLKSIQVIAKIISWNVWQMDGLKYVVPLSCHEVKSKKVNLFGENEIHTFPCKGCLNNDIFEHNGIYSLIMDWHSRGLKGKKIRFVDLIQKNK